MLSFDSKSVNAGMRQLFQCQMNLDKSALHTDWVSQRLVTQVLWAAKLADSVIAVKAKLVVCDTARTQIYI